MDSFNEQLIKKRLGKRDYIIFGASFLAAAVLLFLTFIIYPFLLPLVLIAVFTGVYFAVTSRNLEFEYSVTNGSITIDKIINKKRRKPVIAVESGNIESMGKYNDKMDNKKPVKVIFASKTYGSGSWYFSVHHSKLGNVMVVFDPNDKILAGIKPFLQRQVAVNAFDRR